MRIKSIIRDRTVTYLGVLKRFVSARKRRLN